jgi:catechol 2,3-dioxygenase-like lactoylglutathione lyase family enzyme
MKIKILGVDNIRRKKLENTVKKSLKKLSLVAVVVEDYDDAIAIYTDKLGFELVEDTYQPEQDKRWVVVRPKGMETGGILLAAASNARQRKFIGDQSGGRVFLFLETDNFWRDYEAYTAKGVEFIRPPVQASYGTVAVFKDLYGNLWDLIEYTNDAAQDT